MDTPASLDAWSPRMERLFGRTVHLVEPGALRNPYVREKSEETQVQVYAA